MATFYTGVDKDIYEGGDHFLSMDKFRLNPYEKKDLSFDSQPQSSGITNTNAFTNSGGNNFYSGSTSNLIGDFNTAITNREARINEANRPLRPAQFPAFPDISNAQNIYNRSQGYLDKGYPGTYTDTSMHGKPLSEINKMANEQIMDHQEKARTGQFGPSYIEGEKPTLKRKISDFVYDNVPYINRSQSYKDIMTKGYQEPEGPGLPSILGFLNKMGIQNFASLPQSDQAFIKSQTGYTGPTVFGEIGSNMGHSIDPFGKNVESMFGNYAEGVRKDVKKLDDYFSSETFSKRYGNLKLEQDEEGNWGFTGGTKDLRDKANYMNKMNLARYGFRKNQINKQGDIKSDIGLIDKARAEDIRQTQGRIDRGETNINRDAAAKDSASGASTVNPGSAYGKSQGYTGGTANPHTDTGWSGSTKKDKMATGGRVGFKYGGLAGLL